jgi:hypothetical protein
MSFFEIFQPGLRHLREERDRLKTMVARPKHGGEGPLGIDLDGGKATFTMPSRPAEAESPADGAPRAADAADESTTASPVDQPGEPTSDGAPPASAVPKA